MPGTSSSCAWRVLGAPGVAVVRAAAFVVSWRWAPPAPRKTSFKEVSFMKRYNVNKGSSAGKFRKNVGRTKFINIAGPMRGGIRL